MWSNWDSTNQWSIYETTFNSFIIIISLFQRNR